jgi:hypothetical protein
MPIQLHPISEVNTALYMARYESKNHTTAEVINEFIVAAYVCATKGEHEQAKQCLQCAQYAMFGGYQSSYRPPMNNAGMVIKKYRKIYKLGLYQTSVAAIDLNA